MGIRPGRVHVQWVLKVNLKAYKFARDACIKHALNERPLTGSWPLMGGFDPRPNFIPLTPSEMEGVTGPPNGSPRCKYLMAAYRVKDILRKLISICICIY